MRIPVRHLAGNVIWTTHGSAWGLWRVESSGPAAVSYDAKVQQLGALEGLVKQLRGEAMLLSLCPQVDPVTVAEKMTDGIDLDASPRYVALVERVLDQLDGLELSGRTDWLAVPLPVGRVQAFREACSAARAEVAFQLGLLPAAVSVEEETQRLADAQQLAAGWPAGITLRPAQEAEILWIYGHSARRGVADPLLPTVADGKGQRRRGRGVAALSEAVVCEGGLPYEGQEGEAAEGRSWSGGRLRRRNPFARRWLQVTTEWGESYQALLALSDMPDAFRFPGSEYLGSLDRFDFPVDWVARLQVTSGAQAEAKSRRQARELENQYQEYEEEPSGPPASLEKATGALDAYRDRLASSRTEVEVRAMVAMCTWGATPEEAEERARVLSAEFASDEYELARPRGAQEMLWYGMLPGARTPQVMASYAQYLTARDFAMGGPFEGSDLGDGTGPLCGLHTTSGGAAPVLTDWSRGPRKHASASAAWVGELGSGKTVGLKSAAYNVLAAGRRAGVPGSRGRLVIVDRTPRQEWAAFAAACPGTTQVVTVDDQAAVSLDPLRTFTDRKEAKRRTKSFLTLLLGLAPRSEEGSALSEAIAAVLERPDPSLKGLCEELVRRSAGDPCSRTVARKLADIDDTDLSRVLFDPTLPVIEVSRADTIVFCVSALRLPKRREVELGADQLEDEAVFGRAAMYLIAALCRQVCFESLREFCVAVWDECWWLTSSPEGLELLLELNRDGRKHNAAAFVASHDPDDIGPSKSEIGLIVRGLIPRKFLFRQTDKQLARRGLEFLGLDGSDPDLVATVTTELSPVHLAGEEAAARAGECLHRDLEGRIAGMTVVMPLDDVVEPHMYSDPDSGEQASAA